MNCNEVSLILDDADPRRLDAQTRSAVSAHCATCPACTADWNVHERLAARRLPALPAMLVGQCEELALSAAAAARRRASVRMWVLGGAAAMAAAAGLAVYQADTPEPSAGMPPPVAAVDGPHPDSVPPSSSRDSVDVAVNMPAAGLEAPPTSPPALESERTVVRVLALVNEASDPASRAAIDAFQAAVIDRLRAIGHVDVQMAEGATSRKGGYEIMMTGSETSQPGKLHGRVKMRAPTADGGIEVPAMAEFHRDCAPASGCFDARGAATGIVDMLRQMLLGSARERDRLVAQLLDRALPAAQRLEALRKLHGPRIAGSAAQLSLAKPETMRDAAVLRATLDLAGVTPDPVTRAEIWRTLRAGGSKDLIEPMIAAAQRDPSSAVRNEVLISLSGELAGDSRVRSALEQVARLDAEPLTRALARRGLSGDTVWNEYIVDSLTDSGLPAPRRIEALLIDMGLPGRNSASLRQLLDDESIEALAGLLPGSAIPAADRATIPQLLEKVGSIERPAVTQLLVSMTRPGHEALERSASVRQLARRLDEPGVRPVLEAIRAGDVDPQLRRAADSALDPPEPPPRAPGVN